jgi:hypothetical protein
MIYHKEARRLFKSSSKVFDRKEKRQLNRFIRLLKREKGWNKLDRLYLFDITGDVNIVNP